jgi:hypothetical protein
VLQCALEALLEHERSHRATLSGDGRPGPVEERIGRRLLRLLDPLGAEALALSAAQRIEWIGPEGDALGRVPVSDACAELKRRLERALQRSHGSGEVASAERAAVASGLERLAVWSARLQADPLSAPRSPRRRGSPLHP